MSGERAIGETYREDRTLRAAFRLSLYWIAGCLAAIFFLSLLIGPGGYGGALLAGLLGLLLIGGSWLIVVVFALGEARAGLSSGEQGVRQVVGFVLLPIASLLLLITAAVPTMWLSGWIQPRAILLSNWPAYNMAVARQLTRPDQTRNAMLIWNWGGSVDSDLNVVWDPLDQPAKRLVAHARGGDASCRWMISHYYECGIWY